MKKWMLGILPILILAVIAALIFNGIIQLNRPSKDAFPVRGVDVSHYQGSIDWNLLQDQGIMFAYIKATEGSSYQDSEFQTNWENVKGTKLRAGAYHFFSFESSGLKQSENFIRTVPVIDGMLPPVIDVEPYGRYRTLMDSDETTAEIKDWLNAIEAEYGMRPVIYTTEAFYMDCMAKAFSDYDIWIRSVYRSPREEIKWKFWQYSNRVHLNGYVGEERFVDMNVFDGTIEDFEKYGR
ncbi:MAG: glycoside hydrolase family 25 [Clostridia bacterium]|nr:glycoside hydrolase family 25 [Clostridia bacterium]